MTELERHIIELLLDNDCVIVPGFGGFMAHNLAASYDEKNNVYLPPSRTIGFNPQLTMNDSLLAQAYANCYDISYPEALRQIEHEVDVLKMQIEKEGGRTICGVGRITLIGDGRYDFTPEVSGLMSPNQYGFEAFEISQIETSDEEDKAASVGYDEAIDNGESDKVGVLSANSIFTHTEAIIPPVTEYQTVKASKEKKEIALRIPLSVVRHVAAACVILFVLLSFPSKLGDASTSTFKQSAMDTSILYNILPRDITSGKPESLNDIAKPDLRVKAEKAVNAISNGLDSAAHVYGIVIASRITQKNAYAFVNKLHKEGFSDASVCTSDGVTKVIYKQFTTRDEAAKAKKSLIAKGMYTDCWIAEIK